MGNTYTVLREGLAPPNTTPLSEISTQALLLKELSKLSSFTTIWRVQDAESTEQQDVTQFLPQIKSAGRAHTVSDHITSESQYLGVKYPGH